MSSFPKPHHEETQIAEMETWELLADAIPRGESDKVAELLRQHGVDCSGRTVRSWRNDPDVEGAKPVDANGRRNPLDHFLLFLDAVHARSAEGAEMIIKRVNYELARLNAIHEREELLRDRQIALEARKLALRIVALTDPTTGEKT